MVQPKSGRIEALEGVRGIAALIVAIFHFCSGFLPHIVPDRQPNASPSWLVDTPLEFFYNGPFAVTIFFVLSGFVIANAAANRPFPLILNLVFRYARLAVPVIVSVILAWALLTAFPDEAKKLSHVIS